MAEELGGTYRIVDLTKIPSAESGRVGKYDLVVTYSDVAGRVRVITLPYEQFGGKNEAEQTALLAAAIRAAERERIAFIGREIKL